MRGVIMCRPHLFQKRLGISLQLKRCAKFSPIFLLVALEMNGSIRVTHLLNQPAAQQLVTFLSLRLCPHAVNIYLCSRKALPWCQTTFPKLNLSLWLSGFDWRLHSRQGLAKILLGALFLPSRRILAKN